MAMVDREWTEQETRERKREGREKGGGEGTKVEATPL
jgi:hypothetical protein